MTLTAHMLDSVQLPNWMHELIEAVHTLQINGYVIGTREELLISDGGTLWYEFSGKLSIIQAQHTGNWNVLHTKLELFLNELKKTDPNTWSSYKSMFGSIYKALNVLLEAHKSVHPKPKTLH